MIAAVALFAKNWDGHVDDAEQVARGGGFQAMRERILELARPGADEVVVDFGAGTGLLALALPGRVHSVWAIDSSPAMVEYLRAKAEKSELMNLSCVHASVTSVPLVDGVADLVVSNYCCHELNDQDKTAALCEAFRLLRPGGRLVIGDMMFTLDPSCKRNRRIVCAKIRALARRGVPGIVRLAKNALRIMTGSWEHPASAAWWRGALERAGFEEITIELCSHEGGIASASRRVSEPTVTLAPLAASPDTAAERLAALA